MASIGGFCCGRSFLIDHQVSETLSVLEVSLSANHLSKIIGVVDVDFVSVRDLNQFLQ